MSFLTWPTSQLTPMRAMAAKATLAQTVTSLCLAFSDLFVLNLYNRIWNYASIRRP